MDEVSGLSAREAASQLCDGVSDPVLCVLLCDRLQRLWSDRCECVGKIDSVSFQLVGSDEMTVDAYLRSMSFDLEFLS